VAILREIGPKPAKRQFDPRRAVRQQDDRIARRSPGQLSGHCERTLDKERTPGGIADLRHAEWRARGGRIPDHCAQRAVASVLPITAARIGEFARLESARRHNRCVRRQRPDRAGEEQKQADEMSLHGAVRGWRCKPPEGAWRRELRPKTCKLAKYPQLRREVARLLQLHYNAIM